MPINWFGNRDGTIEPWQDLMVTVFLLLPAFFLIASAGLFLKRHWSRWALNLLLIFPCGLIFTYWVSLAIKTGRLYDPPPKDIWGALMNALLAFGWLILPLYSAYQVNRKSLRKRLL
jgi:cytochrome c biogenesis protein CcdA